MANPETEILLPGQDFDAIAVLAIPAGKLQVAEEHGYHTDQRLRNWGRDGLIAAIEEQGVEAMILRGKASIDTDNSLMRLQRPHIDSPGGILPVIESIGWHPIESAGVVRSVTPVLDLASGAPQLNDPTVRALARDKFLTAELLKRTGLHDGSIAVSVDTTFDRDVLDAIDGPMVFIKPRFGSRSEGVLGRMTKADAERELTGSRDTEYVIEPLVDFSHQWPGEIRALDQENQSLLDRANREGANKELRAYSFGEGEFYFVGRAAQPGATDLRVDDWVFLDQDTIPRTVRALAQEVYVRFAEASGVNEMHLGIDMYYAPSASSGDQPTWRTGEVNAGEPQLANYEENQQAAEEQRKHLALQIARIARKRSLA